MNKTRKGFKKASDLMEAVLHPDESYPSCITKACNVLKVSTSDKKLVLLRISGSIIPDTPLGTNQPWTIGQNTFSSTRSPKHFGVAAIERVHQIKNSKYLFALFID